MADGTDSYRPLSQTVSDTRKQVSQGKSARSAKGRSIASALGSGLQAVGKSETDRASAIADSIRPVSYKHGGVVRKTGLARLHKGEVVVPRGKVKRVRKAMRRMGRKRSGR